MHRVIVTGGAGFIGSHTVVELVVAGYEPIIVDNFSNSDRSVIDGIEAIIGFRPRVYEVDCTDVEEVHRIFTIENPWAVIHFAAFKAVGESVEEPLKYYHNNIGSMTALLRVMRVQKTEHLVFSSSCTVYGQPDVLPVTESTPFKPANSPYGYTKQVCEQLIHDFIASQKTFNAALLRYFNPIGAHSSGRIGELPFGKPNNLVPYITQTAAGILDHLTVFGNDYQTEDGTCVRDFIHVVDLAKAHVQALNWMNKKEGVCEAFNLGQGKGDTVLSVIQSFEKVTGKSLNYTIGPRRTGDVEKIWADVSKANLQLGWKTEQSLEQALSDAWNWQCVLMEKTQ